MLRCCGGCCRAPCFASQTQHTCWEGKPCASSRSGSSAATWSRKVNLKPVRVLPSQLCHAHSSPALVTFHSETSTFNLESTYTPMRCRYALPMAELGGNFYDSLKSITSGYASFDYEEGPLRKADLVRLDLLLNGEPVDALARIVHRCCWGTCPPLGAWAHH